jgi:hypothetical protein
VARTLLDIGALDLLVQEAVAKYGNMKDFHIVLWRQELDDTGSNWNARIARVGRDRAEHSNALTWWDIVPQLRERFNLE